VRTIGRSYISFFPAFFLTRRRPPSSLSVVTKEDSPAMHYDPNAASSYRDEEQELDIPDTPGLGMSPITPKTAGSQFPSTPPSTNGELFHEKTGYFDESKDLDPTCLFVGGLEMTWDDEKVSTFFGRFGGLESVQVVRPRQSSLASTFIFVHSSCVVESARAAFAFVKFNNTESPARAIFEEVGPRRSSPYFFPYLYHDSTTAFTMGGLSESNFGTAILRVVVTGDTMDVVVVSRIRTTLRNVATRKRLSINLKSRQARTVTTTTTTMTIILASRTRLLVRWGASPSRTTRACQSP
jgi:hypothetical protein